MSKGDVMNKETMKTIFAICAISTIGCAVLWFSVHNGGQTTLLNGIYYFSGNIYNESTSELVNKTTSINSSQYDVVTNWSLLPMNRTYLISYFRGVAGIYKNFSFQFIIECNQSIQYQDTELTYIFVFILFNHDDGRIQFVSGVKPVWKSGWHKYDPNFRDHKKLAHQTALQNTQEILELLDLHTTKEITFQEDYI